MSGLADRRAAVRAQLAALSEDDLRLFVDILALDVEAVELPLAEFLALQARQREQAGMLAAAGLDPGERAALRSELTRLTSERQAWEETARACVCSPGRCTRAEFRDHRGDSPGCMVCADLDPDQPCYAAVLHGPQDRAASAGAGEPDWSERGVHEANSEDLAREREPGQ